MLEALARMTGGEIYIPRIPSMRVVDLARVLAPELPQEIVGIRPGEKLHEMLITDTEAPNTVQCGSGGMYIIRPSFRGWEPAVPELASDPQQPVPDGFSYTSDRNDQWLDQEALQRLLNESPL